MIQVPDTDGVVGAAGDEGTGGQKWFLVVPCRGVHLQAPDAGRMEDEGVRFADLKLVMFLFFIEHVHSGAVYKLLTPFGSQ